MNKIKMIIIICLFFVCFSCDGWEKDCSCEEITRNNLHNQGYDIIAIYASNTRSNYIFSATLQKDGIIYVIEHNKLIGLYHESKPDNLNVNVTEITGNTDFEITQKKLGTIGSLLTE